MQIRLHKRQMGTYIHGQRGWMDGASEVTGAQITGYLLGHWKLASGRTAAPAALFRCGCGFCAVRYLLKSSRMICCCERLVRVCERRVRGRAETRRRNHFSRKALRESRCSVRTA